MLAKTQGLAEHVPIHPVKFFSYEKFQRGSIHRLMEIMLLFWISWLLILWSFYNILCTNSQSPVLLRFYCRLDKLFFFLFLASNIVRNILSLPIFNFKWHLNNSNCCFNNNQLLISVISPFVFSRIWILL